jgi:hypothetical protein
LKFLKDWSYKRKLQNQIETQSSPKQDSLNVGKQIGVVFDYQDKNDLEFLKNLKAEFRAEGKFVKLLGYVDDDVEVGLLDFKAFSRKELTWEGIPKSIAVQEFLDHKYDIFFYAVRNHTRPLEFISIVSQSKLKIGTYQESLQDYYDILVDIKPQTRINDIFDQFLKHIKFLSN